MKMLNRMVKTLQEMNITYQETEVLKSFKTKQQFWTMIGRKYWLQTCPNVSQLPYTLQNKRKDWKTKHTFFGLKAVQPQPPTNSDWRYGNCCITGWKSHQSSTNVKKLAPSASFTITIQLMPTSCLISKDNY